MDCTHCTYEANGVDEDGDVTCGNDATCMPVVAPLPSVIEVSGEDHEDEEGCDEDGGEHRCKNGVVDCYAEDGVDPCDKCFFEGMDTAEDGPQICQVFDGEIVVYDDD